MKTLLKVFLFLFFVGIIAIQFVDVDRTNPPATGDIKAPAEVKSILKHSCYQCHSNETEWPWYSYVAPISWLIESDVKEGREHLNFSEWENLRSKKKDEKKDEIWEQISKSEMPPSTYTFIHTNARLELLQQRVIKKWLDNSNYIFDY